MKKEKDLKAMQKALKTVMGETPDLEIMKLIDEIQKPVEALHKVIGKALKISPKEAFSVTCTIITAILRPLKSFEAKKGVFMAILEAGGQEATDDEAQSVKEFFKKYKKESE